MTCKPPEAPDPERLSAAAAEAQARVIEETEEWEIADEEGGDGGPAVKLLPAVEMTQARAFQQGLNRAVRVEGKSNRMYAANGMRNTQRGNRRGGKGTTGYSEDHPASKASIERRGEVQYHAANEKKMRAKAAQDFDEDGWGWIGGDDSKVSGQKDRANEQHKSTSGQEGGTPTYHDNSAPQNHNLTRNPGSTPPHKRTAHKPSPKQARRNVRDNTVDDRIILGNKPKETPAPPQHLMARMQLLDAYEDDGDGGVPLI